MEEKNIQNKKSESALREEKILEFWKENKTFEKSLAKKSPQGEFVFFEGPPTANGKPGIHHLEARAFKDAIPRYKTMQGFHVRRKGGWDTHGLPVELQVEKKLGLNSKKAIEEYGVAKFNQECKESVWEYLDVWNKFTHRIGYWVDQEHPYVTYHNEYIESVWNVVKEINKQNLLYKDYKVVPWCPRCGTALSSHELAQGYEDVKDLSVYVKFRVLSGNITSAGSLSPSADGALPLGSSACETPRKSNISANTYILAWTTTPWTLPGNVALAVGEDIDYVKIEIEKEFLILAKERLSVIDGEYKILKEIKGKDLIGLEYESLYPYLKDTISENEKPKLEKAFKVYGADFVTTADGTGVVHTAVMYGQDDFELGTKVGLPKHHLVGLDGKFLPGTGIFEGRFVRDEDVAVDVIKDLAHRGLLLKKEKYEHSYPHCWRCHTALIYYARDSWYIKVSDPKIKEKMIAENKEINWEPAHIRDGRFGEWLREIKDWAISRERYWGTPLPVWICESCKRVDVIGSIEDLKNKTKKSGNKYFVMRHGGTEANLAGLVSFKNQIDDSLSPEGQKQVTEVAKKILSEKIDLIISSPFTRTRQTVNILNEKLHLKDEQIIFDDRLQEFNPGDFDGKLWSEYHKYVLSISNGWFHHKIPNGESFAEVACRTGAVLCELENKYKNKNIIIVTHGGPAWLLFVNAGLFTPDDKPYHFPNTEAFVKEFRQFNNAEVRELPFVPFPHNADFELDLHKPYIDEVNLICAHRVGSGQACGGKLIRTREVMDVWFDSGCMPFAQDNYPFKETKILYPADFISEAIDQTRGWFYTLHAVGILMGRGKAYKNVICLGHLMDAVGKKMSKSLGNIVDPWEMIEKYGVDTLRLWMYSVNQPGESKNFDEKTVALLYSQVFGLLYNVLAFYELYRDKDLETIHLSPTPLLNKERGEGVRSNVLDIWILARLDELISESTKKMDDYKLLEPVRAIKDFIGDLSTWYLRRSRERIKNGDKEARQTLYYILETLVKILAPFAPFTAEDIWLKLKTEGDGGSVHLAEWPVVSELSFQPEVVKNMQITRRIVTQGLEARQKAGIKVRQPLSKLEIKDFNLDQEYVELIKDELNVKEVIENKNIENEVELDINITSELKQEGDYRELVRAIQDFRKKKGLTPSEFIRLIVQTSDIGKKFIQNFEEKLKKAVIAKEIQLKENDGEEVKIDELYFKVRIDKINK
ncbi:MAG: class I tRNA ligase family protein [Candidatus Pacebacteria bacterium]|nr:class I tRNA ligase family protein [Candidatus Paceibacterota bacterium]